MFKAWGISLALVLLAMSTTDTSKPEWALNATTIEACSCPMFCQCYFNPKPAAHHEHGAVAHYCQFNNAYKVNHIDTWEFNKNEAHATIDGGKTAEVKLHRFQGNTDDPVVIHNLKYWGTPRNDGFVMMPNDVETYKTGAKPFEFKGTNGFMITIDMASTDVKQ